MTSPGMVPCCDHCGCQLDQRVGHDDTCSLGCNDGDIRDQQRERIVNLLTEHRKKKGSLCSCGWVDLAVPISTTWEQHVADLVFATLLP